MQNQIMKKLPVWMLVDNTGIKLNLKINIFKVILKQIFLNVWIHLRQLDNTVLLWEYLIKGKMGFQKYTVISSGVNDNSTLWKK